jgi:hypothetical protein
MTSCEKSQTELKMAETIPRLQDDTSFPNDPILVKLLESAQHTSDAEVIIKDFLGFEKTYPQLLRDVLETRDQLKALLPASNFSENGLLREENVYITALTRTGYEYAVAFFAVRALGGAYVPLGNSAPGHEKHNGLIQDQIQEQPLRDKLLSSPRRKQTVFCLTRVAPQSSDYSKPMQTRLRGSL